MKALALTALRRLEWMELPMPELRSPHDVLLQVRCVGICGSDLHYYETGRIASRRVQFPFVLGHECSAVVMATGAAVQRVKLGDEVAVDPAMSCGACDQCRAGRPHTCRHLRFLGCPTEAPGCLSEFIVMPETSVYRTFRRINLVQAALCEPLSIALHAVRLARLQPGMSVGILGAGPIGLCVMLAARHAGAAGIWMTDRLPYRVQFAQDHGARWAGNPDTEDVVRHILNAEPHGLDVVFECAGQQAALDQAVDLLKPGGTLAIVGIPREERVSFHIDSLRRKEITLVNVRRQNQCVQPAMDLVATGAVQPDFLVTHTVGPEGAADAFAMVADYRDGVIKAMIEF
ncbi:MAG: alcohol dehydrogenase catalytic domain-containing protein [Verrucomicrobiae bacterium]|nr:alcohol dehydrogenase catalytic domain-containing protein [Verrucomicrobiae bacterium]